MNVNEVWEKGIIVPGNNPAIYRKDVCGAFIRRDSYGKQTQYGWEIDHIVPVSKGGSDRLHNLRPQGNRIINPYFSMGLASTC